MLKDYTRLLPTIDQLRPLEELRQRITESSTMRPFAGLEKGLVESASGWRSQLGPNNVAGLLNHEISGVPLLALSGKNRTRKFLHCSYD